MADCEHLGQSGHRILIVEDELIIAMDLEDTLIEEGWFVIDCVPTIAEALDAIDHLHPEVVILDLNLQGRPSHCVAERMLDLSIPFVIVSGHGELQSTHPVLTYAPLAPKPWDRRLLMRRLTEVLADPN